MEKQLALISDRLRRAAVQRTATSEHNAISKRAGYQRKVLKKLTKINVMIKKCPDPVAKDAAKNRLRMIMAGIA